MKTPPKSISESIIEETEMDTVFDIALFELLEEIELISDPAIKAFVRSVLLKADPFWIASATLNEYTHPLDEHGPGGMVLHTKRVCRAAYLLSNTFDCSLTDLDILIAAALLHDVTKAQWRDETKQEIVHDAMHPYTIDSYISWITQEDASTIDGTSGTISIPTDVLHKILRLIRCSHGAWSPIPETMPINVIEKILHMADLVAANLHVIIDGTDIVEERWM